MPWTQQETSQSFGQPWGQPAVSWSETSFLALMRKIHQGPKDSIDDLDSLLHDSFVHKHHESVEDRAKYKEYIHNVRNVMRLESMNLMFLVSQGKSVAARMYIQLRGPPTGAPYTDHHFEVWMSITLADDGRLLSLFESTRDVAPGEEYVREPQR